VAVGEAVVRATQAWLQTTWHVQVPFAWLEACVAWLQEEAGGAGHLSQLQINQQVLDQWLLADLRDLNYPVLPEGLSQAQKTQVNGAFCVQVDSLLDVSQPAYGQLRKMRGTVCANDEISAVPQATQRPWEAKPTRMLMLQVTDGVQSLEAMEYQPIPELSAALRPGVKLQLRGQMVCRLGVLLLGPSNVKVLGGEVEELVDRNNQVKLQVSLVCQIWFMFVFVAVSEASGLAQSNRDASVQGHRHSYEHEHSDFLPSDHLGPQEIHDHHMEDEDFPDEDFDNLPLDELDAVIFQDRSTPQYNRKRQISSSTCSSDSTRSVKSQKQSYTTSATEFDRLDAQKDALNLTSPPFTYVCLLEQTMFQPDFCTAEIRLKAFIVTLLGKLSSSNGVWNICVTISDGTGYLDVELSDEVLTGLLGFSVPEKAALKRDPARRGELDAGMRRCQEELVDMCCVMTVTVEGGGRRAVVTKVEPVSEEVLQELEQRMRDRRK
uniref:RecQ-mediated genome instability protein 1 n=1 Tax=Mola mola TaxID=94237 RepID=A0A3Q3X558_MOLML